MTKLFKEIITILGYEEFDKKYSSKGFIETTHDFLKEFTDIINNHTDELKPLLLDFKDRFEKIKFLNLSEVLFRAKDLVIKNIDKIIDIK